MFGASINSTPLVSQAADAYFQNITGEKFNGDVTFLSTLRALVSPRMGSEDQIVLRFRSSSYSKEGISGVDLQDLMGVIVDRNIADYNGCITIHNFTNGQIDNYANLEAVKASFEFRYPGWHRVEKITDFFFKSFYVLCFINPERKSVYLFIDRMDLQRMHYLQCAILAFLPWYFDPQKGVTESEMALINSLRSRDANMYIHCICEIAKQFDLRQHKIRCMLADFEMKGQRAEVDRIHSEIDSITDMINDLNRRIRSQLSRKDELGIRMLGLEAKIAEGPGESEIMDYFMHNKNLEIESTNETSIRFACKGYITYFDEEIAKRAIDNKNSFVYCPDGESANRYIRREDMKRLMYALFIEQTIRIKVCAAYSLDTAGSVSALGSYAFGYEFDDCTPNPHIDGYRCMGNYIPAINDMLAENNYIGAIEQCIASCQSLNFADPPVMKLFMKTLYGMNGHNNNCIELPDGRTVTPKGAINWLMEQKQEDEQESEEDSNE